MDAGVRSTVKFRTVSIALTLGIVACAALSFAAQKGGQPSAAYSLLRTRASSPSSSEDKPSATKNLKLRHPAAGGSPKAPQKSSTRGQFKQVSGSLTMRADGAPISYEWSAQTEKTNGAHILFANGVASITLQMQGARPFQQDLSFNTPLIAVLDNNSTINTPSSRASMTGQRWVQTFPVIIPQELTPVHHRAVHWLGKRRR